MKKYYKYLFVTFALFHTFSSFAQVPVYSSFPSAKAVIFLDFDGHTVEGTSWNGNGPIVCGPSNLTTAQMTEIYNRVAEDYRPFNINITTDSTKYWAAPAKQRMRVLLTITYSWYGNGAGGVSYINSFTWGDNSPAFVFTSLLKYNTKSIAEAAAHEAGHTLGLRHQAAYDDNCVKTSDYNSGVGSGEIGWAPIMGVGYYRNYTLWHNGSNPYGCTTVQDDLGIIAGSKNGFGYRADDYSASFSTAAPTSIADDNTFSVSGIISTDTDEDLFKVAMPVGGRLQLNATPYGVGAGDAGSNLDVKVNLYDKSQQLIATYNPPEVLNATIDTTLDAGTYYYSISGANNQYATEYASLGSYSVQGTFAAVTPLPLRQLKLEGVADNNKHKLTWLIDADEAVVKESLEVSSNGSDFKTAAELATNVRTYAYMPEGSGNLQYRLSVTFDNGKQYYSNIIVLRNHSIAAKPSLMGNVVQGHMLQVNSPSAAFGYTITDYSGKQVGTGRLVQGSNMINAAGFSSGLYLIQYHINGDNYVEKFVKQ